MLTFARLALILFTGISLVAYAQTPPDGNAKPEKSARHEGVPSHSLKFSGAVKTPREFTTEDLMPMQAADSGSMPVICASGASLATVKNFRGVRLVDPLNQVGIDEQGQQGCAAHGGDSACHRWLSGHLLMERVVQHRDW